MKCRIGATLHRRTLLRVRPVDTRTARAARAAGRLVLIAATLAILPAAAAGEESASASWRRWSLGVGISSMSTSGSYGNNAAIIQTEMFGDDGIPFTGDPNEVTTCTTLIPGYYPEVDPFCDPRPDDLVAREGTVEDAYGFHVAVSFDVTHRFHLALDASWFKSEVGPIDVYGTETYPFFFSGQVIALLDRDFKEPIPAGELTQIPVTLSALVRLRPDRTVRPYFGAGGGMVLASFERDEQVDDLVGRLETLRVRGYASEKGRNVTPPFNRSEFEFDGGLLRFRDDVVIEVDNGLGWHLRAGIEYRINDRFSMTFDARYIFANQEVTIETMGHEQLDIFTWPDELYHPNGRLAVFSPTGGPPNPYCVQVPGGFGCAPTPPPPPGKRITPIEGPSMGTENGPPFFCPGRADFDGDGQRDWCYRPGLKSPGGRDVLGMWVVQGGAIETSGYSFAIGMRLHL